MVPPAGSPLDCDIAIAGGGLVGLSLAVALGPLPWSVVVLEPVPASAPVQPSFDARSTALAPSSQRLLAAIGAWPGAAAAATPIRRVHVADAGSAGLARIDAAGQGLDALGCTVPNAALGQALRACAAAQPRLRLLPVAATGVQPGAGRLCLAASDGSTVSARLVVAADGAASPLRGALGIDATVRDYRQQAIVANVATSRPHDGVAYERFTADGPLAALPAGAGQVTFVWTLPTAAAGRLLALDDATFLAALQQAFGYRLGRLLRVGRRDGWPLALTAATALVAGRAVLVGNAAQSLHPAAAQGFNLALRDVAALADLLADAAAEPGAAADPGAPQLLQRYAEWRRADRGAVIRGTDALVRLFGSRAPPLRAARRAGLWLFDLAGPLKREFGRRLMGLAGPQPRLLRGLPLRRG